MLKVYLPIFLKKSTNLVGIRKLMACAINPAIPVVEPRCIDPENFTSTFRSLKIWVTLAGVVG